MKTTLFLLLGLLGFMPPAIASPPPDSTIFGIGIQFRIDLGLRRTTNYVLSANFGLGRTMGKNVLLSYQFNANLARGGLGNSQLFTDQNSLRFDLVNAFSMTVGTGDYRFARPLYSWTPNYAPSLITPYRHALTLSTNFLWNSRRQSQQIGAFCLTSGDVLLGYYNDGPPFNNLGLGDGYDRWWTGGGYLHIVHQPSGFQGIARFDKFTGFGRDAFELGNALRLRYAPYADIGQMAYNYGRLSATLIHPSRVGFSFSLYNILDVQDFIHRSMRLVYHPSIYRWRWALGGQYWNFGNPKDIRL